MVHIVRSDGLKYSTKTTERGKKPEGYNPFVRSLGTSVLVALRRRRGRMLGSILRCDQPTSSYEPVLPPAVMHDACCPPVSGHKSSALAPASQAHESSHRSLRKERDCCRRSSKQDGCHTRKFIANLPEASVWRQQEMERQTFGYASDRGQAQLLLVALDVQSLPRLSLLRASRSSAARLYPSTIRRTDAEAVRHSPEPIPCSTLHSFPLASDVAATCSKSDDIDWNSVVAFPLPC
eukprot:6177501-Pleurochrysis_carterae.AAC.2